LELELQDRQVCAKEHAGRAGAPMRTWNNAHSSPQRKGAGAAHPKSKFLKSEASPAPAHQPGRAGIVTVQEEGAVMKEWSAVRGGDGQDHWKSPSLFWEIRLKESKVKASEHEKNAKKSSIHQIIEACDMLNHFSGRDAANIDPAILEQVKDQIFAGIFADYATNSKKNYRSKLELLQSCVPYYVVAERQFSETHKLSLRLQELEKQFLDEPKAKSFVAVSTQTATDELNKTSGIDALRATIDKMQALITDLSAEKFAVKLDAEEKVTAAQSENVSLRDQLDKLIAHSAAIMAETELIRANAELMSDKNAKTEGQNENLWARSSGLRPASLPACLHYSTPLLLSCTLLVAPPTQQLCLWHKCGIYHWKRLCG